MVDYGLFHGLTLIAMLQIVYLKPELQSAKHLVSLDAYNLFIAATITEVFSHQYYQNSFSSRNRYHILDYRV